MNIIKTLVLVMMLSGCATSPPSSAPLTADLVTGEWDEKTKVKEIKDKLKRSAGGLLSTAGYDIEATLYTEKLLNAEVREKGKMNLDTLSQVEKNLEGERKAFLNGKTCFAITLKTININDGYFKYWRIKAKTGDGNLQEGSWVSDLTGVSSVPTAVGIQGERPWANFNIVCFAPALNLTKSITLVALPQLGGYLKPTEMTWEVKEAGSK